MQRNFLKTLIGLVVGLGIAASAGFARADYNPRVLRIGFQKSASLLTLLKAQGSLEKRFSTQGVEVKRVEFPAGPQLLEGLNVGAIDFGYVGEAPPVFAQAAGANFVYVGQEEPSPAAEALIVPRNSAIHHVADLKGKKIALNKGSNVHFLLVKLLEKSGLTYADVQPIFLPPADARAAFERGSVDAWVIWDPYTAAAEKQIDARILADGKDVVNNYAFFLAERQYAEKSGEVIRQLFDELQKQGAWINRNHKEAAAQLSPLQGLDQAIVEQSIRRYSHNIKPINASVLAEQQKLADTFFELKLIPKAIKVREAAL